ncbi:MAG: NAD(P)/FAD-dependent oxidoreductase [Actinobacteria bacterium]|nr:MAG: NAD(P)/FAD-dependent oxidoreductase [Actinomycetota bacterium]
MDSPSEQVDVLVVGAGPAGLAVAQATASAGLTTLVIERQKEIAEHVRTSGMTASSTVRGVGAPPDTYHSLESLRIVAPGASAAFPATAEAGFCVLDVRRFYRWLGSEAAGAGARIVCGTIFRDVLWAGDAVAGCVAESRDRGRYEIRARVTVDAGGHRAQVSKRARLHPGFKRFGVGAEYELVAPHVDQREAVLVVGERYAPSGYAWSFPWGGTRVRLGVGLHHADVRDDPKERLARLLQEEAAVGLGLAEAAITEYHYGLIPAETVAPRFAGDGVLAVGDAAGHASLVVGEGIRISLRAVSRGSSLTSFEERFRREFGRELRIGAGLNRRLAAPGDDARWNRRVELLATMPPELVFDLLQSRVRPWPVLRWLARRPTRLVRVGALTKAAVARR